MDSDRDLRAQFRRALDDVVPPAPWLEAAAIEDLRKRRASKSVNPNAGRTLPSGWPRSFVPLAAGVLIFLLAAATAAAFLELHLAPRSSPAAMDVTTYQAMVSDDANRLAAAGDGTSCMTLQSVCPAPGKPVLVAYQRWLDDLNRSQPPPRFALIDAQMRRHLVAAISDLNSVFAAYRAQNQGWFDSAGNALQLQGGWLEDVATSVATSHEATAAAYAESVRTAKENLGACPPCQSLAGTSSSDCTQIQSIGNLCVINAMSTIEVFEAAVVRAAAPSSLAEQDAHLQRDLAQADTAILAMATAQLTGDQAGFNAGRVLYQQALPAINADIAGILGG